MCSHLDTVWFDFLPDLHACIRLFIISYFFLTSKTLTKSHLFFQNLIHNEYNFRIKRILYYFQYWLYMHVVARFSENAKFFCIYKFEIDVFLSKHSVVWLRIGYACMHQYNNYIIFLLHLENLKKIPLFSNLNPQKMWSSNMKNLIRIFNIDYILKIRFLENTRSFYINLK